MTAELAGHELAVPAVIDVVLHRHALPIAIDFAPPQQRCGDDVVAVAIDVGLNLDPLADDPFDRKAAAIDQRLDGFDMKRPAQCRADHGLGCFIHGDAKYVEHTRCSAPDWRPPPNTTRNS